MGGKGSSGNSARTHLLFLALLAGLFLLLLSSGLAGQGLAFAPAAPPAPLTPTLGIAFPALDYNDSGGGLPPDPQLAAGPDHLVALVNQAVAIYDKSGSLLSGPVPAGSMFEQAPCTTALSQPGVLYDEEAGRWFLAYHQGRHTAAGGYCVLVSQTGDPTGDWHEYFFQTNSISDWIDSPRPAVGDNHIFIGANVFTQADRYLEARLYALHKNSLYAGSPATLLERRLGANYASPQPLNLHGYHAGTWPSLGPDHYFLADNYNGAHYPLLRWNPESDTFTNLGAIDLGYLGGFPLPVPQGGSDLYLDGGDFRPLDFEYRNGYGWTTMTIACDPGNGTPVNCLRWAQLDLATHALGPAGSGLSTSPNTYRFYPDLALNHCNDLALGYTASSSSTYPSIWVSGRLSTDPAGTLQPETQVKAGEIAYDASDRDTPPLRWGAYTAMTTDPDGSTFWYIGEYSKITNNPDGRWGTYITSLSHPGCDVPFPIIGAPATITSFQAADQQVTRTLTLSNSGTAPLSWTMAEDAAAAIPWLEISPLYGTTPPAGHSLLELLFDSTGLPAGTYTATLSLSSNDPLTPQLTIPLTLTVDTCASQPPTPEALHAIPSNGTDLLLSWSGSPANDSYQLHSSIEPYFQPLPGTWLADFPAGAGSHTEYGSLNSGQNSYYLLLSTNCNSTLTAASNTVGTFQFPLIAGQ